MHTSLEFSPQPFDALIGGQSVIEMDHLAIFDDEEAKLFAKTYGLDWDRPADQKRSKALMSRAVTFLKEQLLNEDESIPSKLLETETLENPLRLLLFASGATDEPVRRWACAILKVMHVLVHLESDLFRPFRTEIQDQILKPIQAHVLSDPARGTFLGSGKDGIPLKKFELKSYKTSNSGILKLLAKPDEVAFSVLDRMGVRFVTKHLFDTFRVMRYLVDEHLVGFPNIISDQSNNTLYPVNLFLDFVSSLNEDTDYSLKDLDDQLLQRLEDPAVEAQYRQKLNAFSSKDYRFIKFIARSSVEVETHDEVFRFFYPFEVQIVDYQTHLNNLSGPASHEKYKRRQKRRARARVLGLKGES